MTPSLAVIVLNYKRPQNIGVIVRAAREALPDAPILVLDQAETGALRDRDDIPWDEVWYRRARTNLGAGARVPLAASLPFDHYLAIDDDTFLSPGQIRALIDRLLAESDRAHGIWGERVELEDGRLSVRPGLQRIDAAVSILNQVYAFSRGQAAAALELSARIGFAKWSDVRVGNDILLSCGSAKPPLCHDLGDIEYCPTSGEAGIAVWRSEGFRERRAQIVGALVRNQAIAVFSPLVITGQPS